MDEGPNATIQYHLVAVGAAHPRVRPNELGGDSKGAGWGGAPSLSNGSPKMC